MPCSSFPLLDRFTAFKFSYWFLPLIQQFTLQLINTATIKPTSIPITNNIYLGTIKVRLMFLLQATDGYKLLQLSQRGHFNISAYDIQLVQLHDSFYLKKYLLFAVYQKALKLQETLYRKLTHTQQRMLFAWI
jgi:hypothetical protein